MAVTVSVTRGKTLGASEKITNDKLNLGFLPSISVDNALTTQDTSYVVVELADSPTSNGTNLKSAYEDATQLTPNGNAIAADNRATVLIPPGNYELSSALDLDTQYVDFIGLSHNRKGVRIYGALTTSSSGVVNQTASDVRIANLTIENTAVTGGASAGTSTDPCAYYPDTAMAPHMYNVLIKADGTNATPMRPRAEYAGTYEYMEVDGPYSFGAGDETAGTAGELSGTLRDAKLGQFSLGKVTGRLERVEADGLHMDPLSGYSTGDIIHLESDMDTSGQAIVGTGIKIGGRMEGCRIIWGAITTWGAFLSGAKLHRCYLKGTPDTASDSVIGLSGSTPDIYNCTVVSIVPGTGETISASASTNCTIAHCRLTKAPNANANNQITASQNVEDSSVL